ncbi:hypothetical protein [Paraliomyxa miuraensis]|uniref:hypothetical protein n=1 Tax=Paraliomyxa miuraensis TaxID=376150 RepID=UPI00225599BF|nr:hypothetical protein [Paraliomyxa miuraensis]MCX4247847.1 hypothetical protein [Paraliomyxa miuraensis]
MARTAPVLLVPLLASGCGDGPTGPADLGSSSADDGLETTTGSDDTVGDAGDANDDQDDGVDGGSSGTGMDSTGGFEDDGFGMDDDMPLVVKVPDIKEGQVAVGTLVELQKVRLITPKGSAPHGSLLEFYVQDPEGGARSGILVRIDGSLSLDLQPGDEATIQGVVRRADGIRYLLCGADDIVVTSWQGDLPPAVLEVGELVGNSPVIMDFEGSLVRIEDVDVTGTTSMGDPLLEGVLVLDDRFGEGLPVLGPGQALGSVTGALMITPQGLAIGPRSGDDVTP